MENRQVKPPWLFWPRPHLLHSGSLQTSVTSGLRSGHSHGSPGSATTLLYELGRLFYIYLFIWLCLIFVVTCEI